MPKLSPKLEKLLPATVSPAIRDMLVTMLTPITPDRDSTEFDVGVENNKFSMRVQLDGTFPGVFPWKLR